MEKYCSVCGEDVEVTEEILNAGPHYSAHRCSRCNKHLGFGKKPQNEGKRAKNKHTPASLCVDFCQMCMRPKNRLGSRGVLETHHVAEIQDGGADTPDNIWIVCTSCHSLIHHQRTYLNNHLSTQVSYKDLQDGMKEYNIPADTQEAIERLFQLHEAVR